ncbi:MAG: hypothetical protein ACOH13_12285 [Flavobacteriales bacterium]
MGPNAQNELFNRGKIIPWLFSVVVMYGISYAWHGLLLNDISEMRMALGTYLALAGAAYALIALGLTYAVHSAILRGWISMKVAFPVKAMGVGAILGAVVYALVFFSGFSFASHELHHVFLDAVWQVSEQAIGGLMVAFGIIYDMHRRFMKAERAS